MNQRAAWSIAVRSQVIVDNDWSGDPDGLVALAHHLLSPSNRVLAVTSTFLNPVFRSPRASGRDGAALARELVELIGDPDAAPAALAGCDTPFGTADRVSPAADAIVGIVRAAQGDHVVLACGGPLTNVADALDRAPDIAARIRLLWVGGSLEPGAAEYNRDTDPGAAEFVLGRPGLAVVQFPMETYRTCAVSVAELEHDLGTSGEVGAWLWSQYAGLPIPAGIEVDPVWPLGDSPPVLLTALGDRTCTFVEPDAAAAGARITVCTAVDVRLLVGDLLAKLRLHERRRRAG